MPRRRGYRGCKRPNEKMLLRFGEAGGVAVGKAESTINKHYTPRGEFMEEAKHFEEKGNLKKDEKPAYVPPQIITYTSEELLEQIGPAMACSISPCLVGP